MKEIILQSLNCIFFVVGIAGLITCAYETIFGRHTGRHRYPGLIGSPKRSRR